MCESLIWMKLSVVAAGAALATNVPPAASENATPPPVQPMCSRNCFALHGPAFTTTVPFI